MEGLVFRAEIDQKRGREAGKTSLAASKAISRLQWTLVSDG